MYKIITADNKQIEVDCITCAITREEIEVIGGLIAETQYMHVSSDTEYPIPGFLIVGSKRHVGSIADFTPEENRDFADLTHQSRLAMREVLGIEKVTIIQEEKSNNSHFHLWLFPWYSWIDKVGKDLSSIRDVMEYSLKNHKTEETIERIKTESKQLRRFMKENK